MYANLKKYYFHQNEIQFFGYLIFLQDVYVEDKWIKAVYNWPKLFSERDI